MPSKVLKEINGGLMISLLIFVPYMTVIYLFVQWNLAQTNNVTKDDLRELNFKVQNIKSYETSKTVNKQRIKDSFIQIISQEPYAKWRIDGETSIDVRKNDSITVKYLKLQFNTATSPALSGKIQRFFSTYGDHILIYQLIKDSRILIEKPINEYDEGTRSRGQIFMALFTLIWFVALNKMVKYLKRKGLWVQY
ncbi:hypothetical protein [Sphingobacterium sp. DR205]|uniref:hypothetical protein n=1 Tax=Sphingobacterium sp. DR205 TaxID=2713573 RepID=UPI0013E4B8A4|nr:hypothetical protein [Sphingobacterium sp. DR205]QIH36733.1 hypothetical protein G6053_29485 [Sphingobacterium sp. DR205]